MNVIHHACKRHNGRRFERMLLALGLLRRYNYFYSSLLQCTYCFTCFLTLLSYRRRRRQRVVVEDRTSLPYDQVWRIFSTGQLSSAGGVLFSLRSRSIHRLLGRPGQRFQLWSGRVLGAWAGVSSESLAM